MSRLIVKNLPNNITADKLRELFSQKGEITDVQLKYTREKKFRNFGFIGFKTEDQATEARDFFNGSCIKTTRIVVESCVSLGDESKPQAWSKYATDSSAYKKLNNNHNDVDLQLKAVEEKKISKEERKKVRQKEKDEKIREILEKHKDDPLFSEFMEVHASKIDKAIWSNDSIMKKNKKGNNDETDKNTQQDNDSGVEGDNEKTNNELETTKLSKKEKKKFALQAISDLEYMKSLIKKKEKSTTDETGADETKEKTKPSKKKKEPRNRLLFYVKIQGMSFSCKKRDVKDFFKPLVPFTIRIPRCKDTVQRGFCYIGFRSEEERKKALFKNKTFLAGNRVIVNKYDSKQTPIMNEGDNQPEPDYRRKAQEESLKNEESIAESGRIYVRNLPYITTENELQELFQKFGTITEINVPVDKITHQSKGFGTITFMFPEHAVQAYTTLDGSVFCGRMLHLLPGKQKQEVDPDEEGLTYKQKKERKQRMQAGSAHNWNTLFLGANAVADVVASTYNTTKEKLLEGNSKTSAAVRLALGETQLVATTRKFLEENGVCLDVFNQIAKKRSKTIILVKNMPAQSTTDEVRKVFEPFGLIARLVMPPHGITALVEFVEPSEARQALSKLAYTKFKYLPLYLEWAPDNVFTKPADKVNDNKPITEVQPENDLIDFKEKNQEMKTLKENKPQQKYEVEEEDEMNDVPDADTTLFVKGLNFETREGSLRQHFEACGRLFSVTVALKKDPNNPGEKLSMGYGFVQYYSKYATEKALKTLQLTTLDAKQIELKRSERTGRVDLRTAKKDSQVRKQTGTKIIARNVPFQANQKEIQEIFGTFGEIKALRMPKKMGPGENSHRGFCFVEYHTKSDAKNAFEALCQSTHLYGRRLVLEWAVQEDESNAVENIRKRTAETFHQAMPGGKKTRKALVDPEGVEEEE